jgi:hypothetical protein
VVPDAHGRPVVQEAREVEMNEWGVARSGIDDSLAQERKRRNQRVSANGLQYTQSGMMPHEFGPVCPIRSTTGRQGARLALSPPVLARADEVIE